jgi:hypothetical protein
MGAMTSQVNIELSDLLTPAEREEYSSLVHVVRTGVSSFYEAGKALTIIRDKRLYREKYVNFQTFCEMEFNMSKSYAHRIICGCETIDKIEHAVKPSSERVVRELNKAPPASQKSIWKRSLEISPKPSHSVVHKATIEVVPETHHPDAELLHRLRAASKLLNIPVPIDTARIRPFILVEIITLIALMVASLKTVLNALISRKLKHMHSAN